MEPGFLGSILPWFSNYCHPSGQLNELTPCWTVITIIFEVGVLGFGSVFIFLYLVPYLERHAGMHPYSDEDRALYRRMWFGFFPALGKVFRVKPKKAPDHPVRFIVYLALWGACFILLFEVLAILLTEQGWHYSLSWDSLYYNLLFARTANQPNGAHIISYLPIPILGLWVAWKFRKGVMLDVFLGLIVAVLGTAIHEGVWIAFYYAFYWQYLSWGTFDNVAKDVFFVVMLYLFYYIYRHYPFQKIPLKTFKWPTMIFLGYNLVWALMGYHISVVNNYIYGQTIYGITQWWGDPLTNAIEQVSWVFLYLMMWWEIRKIGAH